MRKWYRLKRIRVGDPVIVEIDHGISVLVDAISISYDHYDGRVTVLLEGSKG